VKVHRAGNWNMRDPKKERMKSAVVEIERVCGIVQEKKQREQKQQGNAELLKIKDYGRKSESVEPSEVLRNTGITLSWINTGVLDAGITACLNITDHGLVVIATVCAVGVDVAIVRVLAVVAS